MLADIDAGSYQGALEKLANDILKKTDGCAVGGAVDKNDWIQDCASQNSVYPLLVQAVNLLRQMR